MDDMGVDTGSAVAGAWRLLGTLAVCSAVLAVGLFLTWGQIQPRLQALAGYQGVPSPSGRCGSTPSAMRSLLGRRRHACACTCMHSPAVPVTSTVLAARSSSSLRSNAEPGTPQAHGRAHRNRGRSCSIT